MSRSSRARLKPFDWLLLCAPLALALVVLNTSPNYRITGPVVDGIEQRAAPRGGDFVQEYIGGTIIRRGDTQQLYDLEYVQSLQHQDQPLGFRWPEEDYFPMVYPPFYYQACQGLAALEYPWALWTWVLIGAAAMSVAVGLWWRWGPGGEANRLLWMVAALLFAPWLQNLNLAQKGSWLLLILTGTFLLLRHRRPGWAGVVFGLIAFKPHLGLVIGLGMAWQRQYRFCLGAVATVAVQVGLSYFLAPELWRDYLEVVGSMGNYVQSGGYQLTDSHSLWGAGQLLLGGAGPQVVKGLAITCGLVLVAALAWGLRRPADLASPHFASGFAALVLAMPLLSPHFYTYDLTLVLLPLAMLAGGATPAAATVGGRRRWRGWCLVFYALSGTFVWLAGVTRIQWSLMLLGLAIVWLLRERSSSPTAETE